MKTEPLLKQEEQLAVLEMLNNSIVMGALRKIWKKEADTYEGFMRQEAISSRPFEERASRMVEYASRAEQSLQIENVIRKAAGL